MNAFTVAVSVLIGALAPLAMVAAHRRPIDGLIALELAGALLVLALLCLAEGLHRSVYYGVAVIAAFLSWVGGLAFAPLSRSLGLIRAGGDALIELLGKPIAESDALCIPTALSSSSTTAGPRCTPPKTCRRDHPAQHPGAGRAR